MITIKEVKTRRDLRKFVDFPNKLYADCEQFVPAMYGDDLSDWDRKKNPAFEYCDAKCFLAFEDGKIVGRIGAICNHRANEKWGTRRLRFSQVDFIDDERVSDALFGAVEQYAREMSCNEIHGPLGFCDLDREGMLVEGFDRKSMFITYYNHPYYIDHLTRLGFVKDIDWVEMRIKVPEDERTAALFERTTRFVCRRQGLHVANVKRQSQFAPYIERVFELVNVAYAPLYGTVDLNERQIKRYAKKFCPMINPKLACFVMNEKEEMVAFGVAAPAMEDALKRSRGRLFPTGWIGVLRALHKNTAMDMFLIAVHPKLQGTGINAVIFDHVLRGCRELGIKYAETGPMLETNSKVQLQWKSLQTEQHKRRRCFVKKI